MSGFRGKVTLSGLRFRVPGSGRLGFRRLEQKV